MHFNGAVGKGGQGHARKVYEAASASQDENRNGRRRKESDPV